MRTPVCELLGIEQPIVLAPMVAVPRLAAAVSNAGALGMVTLTWSEDIGAVVRETAALTARPFCGNLVLTEDRHRRLEGALDAGLRIVSFFLGDPGGYIKQVHDAGGIVMHTVGTAEEARRGVASGVAFRCDTSPRATTGPLHRHGASKMQRAPPRARH